jgi:hypothetical protein
LFTGVVDTGEKFIAGDKAPPITEIRENRVINLSAVSVAPPNSLSPVSLTPLLNSFAIISENSNRS